MGRTFALLLGVMALLASSGSPSHAYDIQSATLTVSGQSNIFGAGHATPPNPGGGGAGLLPPGFAFGAMPPGAVVIFDQVSGTVSCCGDINGLSNDADGGSFASGTTDINSTGGISGLTDDQHTMFLVGVFTSDAEPADPAPARLDFGSSGSGEHFGSLYPALDQTFFVGDGLVNHGSGAAQFFFIPAGATHLYLGFADALQFGDPTSDTGWYDDNLGSLSARFTVYPYPPLATRPTTWGRLKTIYR